MRSLILSLSLLVGISANAGMNIVDFLVQTQVKTMSDVRTQELDWKVGDTANYSIDMGFIQGTMKSFVREAVSQGYWVEQDADLGFAGQQKIEILFSHQGQILEMRVNGQKQTPPDGSNQEIVDQKEDNITVAAGTFDCIYLKIHDKKENQDSEAWLNPLKIPVAGLIKTIAPSQFGQVTIELTSYEKK